MNSLDDQPADLLTDELLVAAMVPWACPCDFGPRRRYELRELIGAGRDSLIFRATDRVLSSDAYAAPVAIKIAPAGNRLRTDALSARRITHRYVLTIIDQGTTPDGVGYAVAEYIDGGDLAGRPGPWPPREAAALIAKLARGVQAAHIAGVVHCDIKPANILITADGDPKLGDFDLCRSPEDPGPVWRGNLAFMAPEQLSEDPASIAPPADIYALGGLLYWLLTGVCANGGTAEEIRANLAGGRAPPPPGIERDLDKICARALAVNPEDRHHSAGELADDLDRWLRHEPIPWAENSARRLIKLWCIRRPARAVLLAFLATVAAGGIAIRQYMAAQAVANERRIAAEAQQRFEAMQADLTQKLRILFTKDSLDGDADYLQNQYLPFLIWIEWIGEKIFDSDALADIARRRVDMLRVLRSRHALEDPEPRVESLLAGYCLAYFLLFDGSTEETREVLASLRADWSERLRPVDPVWVGILVMECCTDALDAHARGEETRPHLRRARSHLAAGASTPMYRLLDRVADKVSGR